MRKGDKMLIKRGEIFLADLGKNKGSIQSGIRPVLVISNPKNNMYSLTINILPITSQIKKNLPVHVSIGIECGLQKKSTVLTEQIITVNKSQLIKFIGKCNNYKMIQVTKAMFLQFYMQEELQPLANII
ncbi:MAG TPA: type II toxin-antitoxin system PemK/MazF family toxin [Bacteroidales bacterium]|nr:type II toxin-antitoxin system PemK/MazF family toxin [Bacteroidales bacterium]